MARRSRDADGFRSGTHRRLVAPESGLHTRLEQAGQNLLKLLILAGLILAIGNCTARQPADAGPTATETTTLVPEQIVPIRTPFPTSRPDVPTRSPTSASTPSHIEPTVEDTATPPSAGDPLDRARADLAKRLGIDVGEIAVVEVQADEFPASNLGCPGKDLKPMPAFVTGIEIVLAIQGQAIDDARQAGKLPQYVYRARKHELAYCGTRP